MFLFKLRTILALLGSVGVIVVILLLSFSVNAQRGQVNKMICTAMELAGMKTYDTIKKKVIGMRKKVIINRCQTEEVICFHSFDQGGHLSCIKR